MQPPVAAGRAFADAARPMELPPRPDPRGPGWARDPGRKRRESRPPGALRSREATIGHLRAVRVARPSLADRHCIDVAGEQKVRPVAGPPRREQVRSAWLDP